MTRGAQLALLTLLALCEQLFGNTPDNNEGIRQLPNVVEGDIVLNTLQLQQYHQDTTDSRKRRAVTISEQNKWPGRRIPYTLSPTLSGAAVSAIREAIDELEKVSCLQFPERNAADHDYLNFYQGLGCMSQVGRQGGPQNVSIGRECSSKGVVIHEIFHALGRWHEQSRPDRDEYILINTSNIQQGKHGNFKKVKDSTTQGIPYDYDSIMHYDAYAFTSNSKPTIKPLDSSIDMNRFGQRNTLSEMDVRHLIELYCSRGQEAQWGEWSSCSRTCGQGIRLRTRSCPHGTIDCWGERTETEPCSNRPCPRVSRWGAWSSWSACSVTCGDGKRLRSRLCHGGTDCKGDSVEMQECKRPCPYEWGPWGKWGACSSTCEGGVATRTRLCLRPDGSALTQAAGCSGPGEEHTPCNMNISCPEPLLDCEDPTVVCSGTVHKLTITLLSIILLLNWLCTQY